MGDIVKRCNTCRFYEANIPQADASVGKCRRHPPTIANNSVPTRWPKVYGARDWCGEYKIIHTLRDHQ